MNSWYKSLGGNVSCRSFCCGEKWSKTPLFFSGDIWAADPCHDLPFSYTVSQREAGTCRVFFRMAVKQVKLKETGLQSTTELSSHKYTFSDSVPCHAISYSVKRIAPRVQSSATQVRKVHIVICLIQNNCSRAEKRAWNKFLCAESRNFSTDFSGVAWTQDGINDLLR